MELYRTTGVRKYLDLAMTFIEMRGSQPAGNRHYGLGGTDQTQDRVPLRRETEAVGHPVTATYLYCGAADAYMETGDGTLLEALERIWSDVTRRKMYVHGGVGKIDLEPHFDAQLLGGVVTLEGRVVAAVDPGWSGGPCDSPVLYKELDRAEPRPVRLRLIPYYAWANRGPAQMTVWLPLD